MKHKPSDLSEQVRAILEEDSIISCKVREIELQKEILQSDRARLDEAVRNVRELMMKGARLDNIFVDYAFYHYGAEAGRKISQIEKFFTKLSEYRNQLILENCEGYEWRNATEEEKVERTILIGRLQQNPYVIETPYRLAKAVMDNTKIFRKSKGWENTKKDLLLDCFADRLNQNSPNIGEFSGLLGELLFPQKNLRPEGIYIDIFSEMETEETFGEPGFPYYSHEPHQSLIVGDKAVRHYLEKQNLKIITQKISPAGIPNI